MKFCPHFLHILWTKFGTDVHKNVTRVTLKSAQLQPFYRRTCNYINARTVKPYHILTEKDALLKSVCYVTEYTISNCVLQRHAKHRDRNHDKIAWSTALPEKLTVPQVVNKFPAFFETRMFITAFTSSRHLPLS
jgi:hypothetical protein